MDILSDVSVKGNLSLSGDMNVDGTFGMNYNGTKLILSGCGSVLKYFGIAYEDSCGTGKSMDFYKAGVCFNQNAFFRSYTCFDGKVDFCCMVNFSRSITLSCTNGKFITLDVFCDNKLGKYLSVNAPMSGSLIEGSVYRRFSCGGDLVRTNNRLLLTVPENCTKFHIFEGMKGTEFLPVINSYEVASEGCLKKVDMDIFVTGGSIIGERVSTEEKFYLFGFYFA